MSAEAASSVSQPMERRYLRFLATDRVLHLLLLISFTVLGLTGIPQKYADTSWAVWMIQTMGGIEQVRVFHHTAAVVLIMTSIAHLVQLGYRVFVQRTALAMVPTLKDLTDFVDAVKYNIGLSQSHPHYPRYNFIEKLEYWAVVWGTVLMTITGYFLWNPILVTRVLPGELIPAAKIAHGLEAVLAILAIITWHSYFVHFAKFNKSIFTGFLSASDMEEEHAQELERRLAGRVRLSPDDNTRYRRLLVYVPVATAFVVLSVVATWWWLTAETTAITTVPRIAAEEKVYQPVSLEELPMATERTPLPTPLRELVVSETPQAPPTVPHAVDGERAQCSLCHSVDSLIRPAPLSHQDYADDQCLTCHQTAGGEQ
ncbi:MAG: cytochrome b/b6 domain-containing protein [Anaerolineae bacterium]